MMPLTYPCHSRGYVQSPKIAIPMPMAKKLTGCMTLPQNPDINAQMPASKLIHGLNVFWWFIVLFPFAYATLHAGTCLNPK